QIWRVLELPHEVTYSIALSKKQHSPNSLAKVADLGLSRIAPLLDDYGVDPKRKEFVAFDEELAAYAKIVGNEKKEVEAMKLLEEEQKQKTARELLEQ
ncbi:hypothetical protein Tco_1519443, partial [Tanacetum coccineum]